MNPEHPSTPEERPASPSKTNEVAQSPVETQSQTREDAQLNLVKRQTLYAKVFGSADGTTSSTLPGRHTTNHPTATQTENSTTDAGEVAASDVVENRGQGARDETGRAEDGKAGFELEDIFWRLVQIVLDNMNLAGRDKHEGKKPSCLAVACALDMPDASPLSDPEVLDALFEEQGFIEMCNRANGS